ncbi:hypothetical protein [Geodermatophilus obscurus]|uniref:hypothetical protein n=1 Tax=Geodermatophilus obscurus TaxID=1861 RepID=UPI0011410312|nr:hypothetical protein [Geodermatophilus obscurus]
MKRPRHRRRRVIIAVSAAVAGLALITALLVMPAGGGVLRSATPKFPYESDPAAIAAAAGIEDFHPSGEELTDPDVGWGIHPEAPEARIFVKAYKAEDGHAGDLGGLRQLYEKGPEGRIEPILDGTTWIVAVDKDVATQTKISILESVRERIGGELVTFEGQTLDVTGSWKGAASDGTSSYTVEVEISFLPPDVQIIQGDVGHYRAQVTYPELQCGGTWESQLSRRDGVEFDEIIDYGLESCTRTARILLSDGGGGSLRMTIPGTTFSARLQRVGDIPAPAATAQSTPGSAGPTAADQSPQPYDPTSIAWPQVVTLDCSEAAAGPQVDIAATGDVTGDGYAEVFLVSQCGSSTSSWPQYLSVYDGLAGPGGPRRIATLLTDERGTDGRGLRQIQVSLTGSAATVRSVGYSETDSNCCPSVVVEDAFTWESGEVRHVYRHADTVGD